MSERGEFDKNAQHLNTTQLQRDVWRKERGQGMVSAVGEYTPDEFWDLLDDVETLLERVSPIASPTEQAVFWKFQPFSIKFQDEEVRAFWDAVNWLKSFAQSATLATQDGLTPTGQHIADCERDAKRLDWLEEHHTLHKGVDILYVVDGYEVTLMHEDGLTKLSDFHGDNLREALDHIMAATDDTTSKT